jgi:hypothetical protein
MSFFKNFFGKKKEKQLTCGDVFKKSWNGSSKQGRKRKRRTMKQLAKDGDFETLGRRLERNKRVLVKADIDDLLEAAKFHKKNFDNQLKCLELAEKYCEDSDSKLPDSKLLEVYDKLSFCWKSREEHWGGRAFKHSRNGHIDAQKEAEGKEKKAANKRMEYTKLYKSLKAKIERKQSNKISF